MTGEALIDRIIFSTIILISSCDREHEGRWSTLYQDIFIRN